MGAKSKLKYVLKSGSLSTERTDSGDKNARAARRENPAATVDYDTKPANDTLKPSPNAGVTKKYIPKKQRPRPMKRKQRLRLEQGRERGATVTDKTSHKVAASLGRNRKVRGRRKNWDEINADNTGDSKAENTVNPTTVPNTGAQNAQQQDAGNPKQQKSDNQPELDEIS